MGILHILKIISFIISAFCVIGLGYFLFRWHELKEDRALRKKAFFKEAEPKQSSEQEHHWQRVAGLFRSTNPNDWRLAILDADSMLDQLISALGYEGDSFGERLKAIHSRDYPWIQDAWKVHLLRNRLAHEGANFHLDEREVYQAYKIYENIFYATGFLG